MVRRNVAASSWKYPRRMTFSQWRRVPYREKHGLIAQAQCDLLGYWRDCAKVRCRRDRRCLFPDPCYWDRKQAMSKADWAAADALCKPLARIDAHRFDQRLGRAVAVLSAGLDSYIAEEQVSADPAKAGIQDEC